MNPRKKASRLARVLLRAVGWAAAVAGVLLVSAVVFLFLFGLPSEWTDHVRGALRDAGIPVEFNEIRLSKSGRGWILDEVKIYGGSPDQLSPILSADELAVHLLPADWRNLRHGGWRVYATVHDVHLDPPGVSSQQIGTDHPLRQIDRIHVVCQITPEKITIDPLQVGWGVVQMNLVGSVVRREPSDDLPDFDTSRFGEWTEWVLDRLSLEGETSVHLRFHLDPSDIKRTDVLLDVSAHRVVWEERSFGPITGRFRGNTTEYTLEHLNILHPSGGEISIHGRMSATSGEAQLHARSTFPVDAMLDWLPDPIPDLMQEHDIRLSGNPSVEMELGPAPLGQLHERIDAMAREVDLEIGSFRFTPVSLDATLRGAKLDVHQIHAEVEKHPLAGAFRVDLETLFWECDVDAQCNPQFAGLFDEDLDEFISRFSFPGGFPATKLALSQRGRGEPLRMDGTIDGEQFTWCGVPIYRASTKLKYDKRVLTLDPLQVERDDQGKAYLKGSLEIAFPEKRARFDAEGVFSPAELAQIIHPEYPSILDHLAFNGPVELKGRGSVDYGERTAQDFMIEAAGSRVGWDAIETGPFQLELQGVGKYLVLTNATASIWNGTVKTNGRFHWTGNEEYSPYQIHISLNDADIARVAALTAGEEVQRVRGKLDGHLDLSADAAQEFWASVNGKGQVKITNGHLADLPLLGGFTRLIQTTIPGFRFFSLTSLSADVELRDAAVHSSSVELGGTLISATGRGSWSPTEGLDFLVRAEPFRQTRDDRSWHQVHLWAADVLKTGTSPLFRMLELRLEGTLQNPVWRMAALPDEVRDIFRR